MKHTLFARLFVAWVHFARLCQCNGPIAYKSIQYKNLQLPELNRELQDLSELSLRVVRPWTQALSFLSRY